MTVPYLFLVFNHELTSPQLKEVMTVLNAAKAIPMPARLKRLCADFPPEGEFPVAEAEKFIKWLSAKTRPGDYVLVQGEFGLVVYLVSWCFKHGLIPVYSTTGRHYGAVNLADGGVKNIHCFKHVNFRKYPYI